MRKIDADALEAKIKAQACVTGADGLDRIEACAVLKALRDAPTVEETTTKTTREEIEITFPITRSVVYVCKACGTDTSITARFCCNCGKKFKGVKKNDNDQEGSGPGRAGKAGGKGRAGRRGRRICD